MPSLANITIKKHNGTTDIIWTGLQRSAGDKSPAVYRSDTVSTIPANRPKAEVTSRDNAKGTTRIMEVNINFPVLATINGVETIVADQPMKLFVPVLQGVDSAQVNEAVSQGLNLISSAHIRAQILEGYAAN